MNGNGLIARILKREGTEYLFCFPANALIDACAAAGIRPIMSRTERTLVNMADGYTRVLNGRRIGVCTVQYGPGAENAFGGVAQAASDSVPILLFAGGASRNRRGVPYSFPTVEAYSVNFASSTLNPLGVKGVGEGGIEATGAALANAAADALRSLGVEITALPLSPDNLSRWMREARGEGKRQS